MNDRTPTEAKLLPCPFCGGEPRQFNCVEPDGFVSGTFVRCDACGIDINDEYEADAVAAWNRRASPPAPAAEPVAKEGASAWLIRKGSYYYRPNRCGYTASKAEAGRYTEAEAKREAAIEPWHMFAILADDVPGPSTHPLDAAAISAEADDFGALSVRIVEAVLLNLGIGFDASREPGADRRRDRLCRLIEPLLPLADKGEAEGWRPIATAPKDGHPLMLGIVRKGKLEEIHIGGYDFAINEDEESCWWSLQADDEICPTHWRPLPAPPAGGRDGE
jgi:Lar family restriction alleviation protein